MLEIFRSPMTADIISGACYISVAILFLDGIRAKFYKKSTPKIVTMRIDFEYIKLYQVCLRNVLVFGSVPHPMENNLEKEQYLPHILGT